MTAADTAVLVPAPSVFCATVGDEAVLYDDARGLYFGLNPVAARVWTLAAAGEPLGTIRQTIEDEFDVAAEQLQADLLALIADMVGEGLWTVVEGAPPTRT